EERFAKLFEFAPVPISIIRLSDEVRLHVNSAWLAFHGMSRDRALGAGAWRTVWLDEAERARVLEAARRDGHVPGRLVQLRTPDGVTHDAIVSLERITWENEDCAAVATLDVGGLASSRREAQASRERLEAILENSPVSISISSLQTGQYRFVNAAWSQIFGYSREHALNLSAAESGFWASAQERLSVYARLRDKGVPVQVARPYRRPDGTVLELVLTAQLLEFDGEQCAIAVTQDFTEHERARREAQISSERFAKLFGLSPNPAAVGRLSDGVHLEINAAFTQVLGYTREEAIGHSALDLGIWVDPDDRAAIVEQLRRGGTVRNRPARLRHRSGEIREFQFAAAQIDWGGVPSVLFLPHDVTGLERARTEALSSSERFMHLFESNPVPIVITRIPDGMLLEVNNAWLEMKHMSREETRGLTTVDLGTWVDRSLRDKVVADIAAGNEYRNFPMQLRVREGELREILYSGTRVDWKGEPAIVAFLVDVTDITRAAEEIRQLNESLEQKVQERTAELQTALREIESFSYTVSHDLRAPLRHLSAFSGLLRERESVRGDPEAMGYATRVGATVKRLGAMVDSLLEYSRLSRKQITVGKVDLGAEARLLVAEMSSLAGARRVRWEIGSLPVVRGDPVLLRLLLQNLLDNSLKYTRPRQEAVIEAGARREADAWVVYVRDNGVGFDMRYSGSLFGVFQRLHGEHEFEGTGIGLAHAARIVERHGGRIWCDAVLDQGATFFFSLPA
ncbi:MAG TPA: PAS domain S-box protein, partial [Burkholderiales bacterium]|nr:PAS domain S-box protein [Burkholderiales bacterium]